MDNKITTVLFDLDGTLLPMDEVYFSKLYFAAMAKKLAPHGYDEKSLVKAVRSGVVEMVNNDGSDFNKNKFWKAFASVLGEDKLNDMPLFEEFYKTDFVAAKESCGFNPKAKETVDYIKSKGYRVSLATNPIFPSIATERRIKWAGLDKSDFEIFTTYENYHYCKPKIEYYSEICKNLGIDPKNCLMIGNDATEDMVAEKLGMKVFLLTDCLINSHNANISDYPKGNFDDLKKFIDTLD